MSGTMSVVQGGLSKLKKKHFRVKHQKVKLFRANEPILSVFMWGVNHTINELSHVTIPVMLLPDDFRAYSKLKVDNHLFNKENMPSHFKIKEYCPLVFRNLRERFGIDDQDFKESMTSSMYRMRPSRVLCDQSFVPYKGYEGRWIGKKIINTTVNSKPIMIMSLNRSQPVVMDNPGKSGAKFYHSYDRLFVIKTLTSEEVERMHSFLKQYHPYIVERHGKTLLPQYLGMYRLTVDGVEHYMVAMRNVFSNHLSTHRKFDLKGSTVDREASDREREKDLPTYKDNDFVKEGTKIYIGEDAKDKLLETLTADVDFLTRLHLMDYSLLLGIHDCIRAESEGYDMDDMEGGGDDDDDSEGGGGWTGATPPDSPLQLYRETSLQYETGIVPELDIYAIPSSERAKRINAVALGMSSSVSLNRVSYTELPNLAQRPSLKLAVVEHAPVKEIYFLALIDVLTHYGVKKQAAKAAKTVKYGSNVDGISTCDPDQYGKRFIEFLSKAIE